MDMTAESTASVPPSTAPVSTGPSTGDQARTAARAVLGITSKLVRIVTGLFALVLVAQMVLVLAAANPANPITQAVAGFANSLTLGLEDLFIVANPMAQTVLAYGLPAIAWLVIGAVVVKLLSLFVPGRRR